jgi:SAM-dependent methyltransferase
MADDYYRENYSQPGDRYPALYIRHRRIIEMVGNNEGPALDIGCGSGAMLLDLASRGLTAVGFDISPLMLRAADNLFKAHNKGRADLSLNDIENIPYGDEAFSLVVCAGVIEYLRRDDVALREISRVLKPEGKAIITVTNSTTPFWALETLMKRLGMWGQAVSWVKGGEPFPRTKVHSPSSLSRKAKRLGLEETDRAYFHFTPIPFPMDMVLVNESRRAGLKMESLSRSRLGFLGHGCILKYRKSVRPIE